MTSRADGSVGVFPDMHHKMSKKIAQLTKVIYHLNTRNEDHQSEVDALNNSHQSELNMIVRDASVKISKFKELLDKTQNQANLEVKLEKLQKKLDEEKLAANKELKEIKVKYESRESKLAREFQMKFDTVASEIETMQGRFNDKIDKFDSINKELKSALDSASNTGTAGIKELQARHEKEIADLVKTSNEKYQNMLVEQMQAQDDIRNMMTEKFEETKKNIQKDMEQSLGQLRAELTGDKQEAIMKLSYEYDEKMRAQLEESNQKLDKVSAEIKRKTDEYGILLLEKVHEGEKYEKKIVDLQQQLALLGIELNNSMGDGASALNSAQARMELLNSDLLSSRAKITERDEEIARLETLRGSLQAELAAMREVCKRMQKELTDAGGATAASEEILRSKLGNAEAESKRLQILVNTLNNDIIKLKETIEVMKGEAKMIAGEYEARLVEADVEATALRRQCTELNNSAQRLHETAGNEVTALKDKLKEAEDRRIKELGEMEDNSSKKITLMNEIHMREMEELMLTKKVLENKLEEMRKQSDDYSALQRMKFEDQLAELKISHRDILTTLAAEHKTQQDILKTSVSCLETQLDEVSKQAGGEKEALKAEVSKLDGKAKGLQKELDAKKKEGERAESVCNGLKNQVESLREELKASQQAFREKMEASGRKLEVEWQTKLDVLAEEHAKAMSDIAEDLRRLQQLELDALKASHAEEIATLKNALQREASDSSEESARAEQEKLKLLQMLTDERANSYTELENMKSSHRTSLTDQSDRHKKELDNLRKELSGSSDIKERKLLEEHANEIDRMRASHKSSLEELTTSLSLEHEGRLQAHNKASIDERNKVVDDLNEASRAATATLESNHDGILKKLIDEHSVSINKLNDDLLGTRKQLSEFQSKVIDLEETVTRKNADMVTREEHFSLEKDQLLRDNNLKLRQEKEKNENQIVEIERRTNENIQIITDDFKGQKINFEQEKQFLMRELAALHEKWESRESRPEDIEKIRLLEQEMVDKDHLVKKTKDEMMYFKREMLNREESYNQKFGVQPNVGVMNVLKTKGDPKKQQSGKASRASCMSSSS